MSTIGGCPGLLIALGVAGCAGMREGIRGLPRHNRVFEAPKAVVLQAATEALARMEYRLRAADERQGTIVAERSYPEWGLTQYVADPVRTLRVRWWGLEVTMFVSVADRPDASTRAIVTSRVSGRISQMTPPTKRMGLTVIPLSSNGAIEQALLQEINAALWQAAIPRGLAPPLPDAAVRRREEPSLTRHR